MMRRASLLVGALATALVLAGCSGTPTPLATPTNFDLGMLELDDLDRNGLEFLPGTEALEQVIGAARAERTVTMTGTYTERIPNPDATGDPLPGLPVAVTVTGSATVYLATVTTGDVSGTMRVTGNAAVVTGNAGFLSPLGLVASTDWQCVEGGSGRLRDWRTLVDPARLLDTLLTPTEANGLTIGTGAVLGDTVEIVVGSGESTIGTLTVSALGRPVPSLLVAADPTGEGTFTFTGWGEDADLEPIDELADCG